MPYGRYGGGGRQADLDRALEHGAWSPTGTWSLLEVHTARWDCSETLRAASAGMAERLKQQEASAHSHPAPGAMVWTAAAGAREH